MIQNNWLSFVNTVCLNEEGYTCLLQQNNDYKYLSVKSFYTPNMSESRVMYSLFLRLRTQPNKLFQRFGKLSLSYTGFGGFLLRFGRLFD